MGVTLSESEREQLMVLAAYRNRIFRTPLPVRVEPGEILDSFAGLERLVEALR